MNTPAEISLATIEQAAKQFAADHTALAELVTGLNQAVEDLKRNSIPAIKRRVARAAESRAALAELVDQARHLFVQPRTVIFHGMKVGLQKGRGGIEWDDEAKVIQLIQKHFSAAQAELLIKTTRKPIKKAIEDLDIADLKKIGCRIVETGDAVIINPVDSQVDKLVNALLKDAAELEAAGNN
ncbi:MAG TPA: hypothetical protein PKI20_13505 [Verrucomicrobiota bacterium]|jgi:hypothetical protein|nr:hypothetical protein [Verrucomicrobiota bacterium]HQL78710.1 hypothetical protein [Verrucomicrobiota bacterium]